MNSGQSKGATGEFLVFLVEERFFALELEKVIQIISYVQPTIPPQRRPYIEGIIEVRGDFLPLMSLRKRLGLEGPSLASQPVVLILRLGRQILALAADSVVRVLSQDLKTVTEPPPKLQGVRSEFLRGVFNFDGRPLLWINDESLVASHGEIPLAQNL